MSFDVDYFVFFEKKLKYQFIQFQNSALHDLNLASSSNQRQNSKSSSKLFDDIYLEVSALIAANETRPHFLINLFRELQLISSSDPLRTRLMQAFQEVYTQCEANANMQVPASIIQVWFN